jgi:hypothetical protein
VNNAIMSYHAVQVDHDNKVLKAAGMDIDAQGVITYAEDNVNMIGSKFTQTANRITQEVTDRSNADATLTSSIQQEADKISLIVQNVGANGTVTAASIVTAVNADGSSVVISADHVDLQAYVTATQLDTRMLNADALFSNTGYIGTIRASNMHAGGNVVADGAVIGAGVYFGTSAPYTDVSKAISSIGTYSASGGQITIPTTRLDGTAGPDINFNIAATQFYQDAVAAAERRGIAEGESHFTLTTVYVATNGRYVTTVSGSSLPLSNFGNYTLYYKSGEDYYIAANTAHQWYYRDNNYGTDYYQSGGRHYYYDSTADSYYIKTS